MTRLGLLGALVTLGIAAVLVLTILPIVSASTTADRAGDSATAEIAYQAPQAIPSAIASRDSGISNAPSTLLAVVGSIMVVGLAFRRASTPHVGS